MICAALILFAAPRTMAQLRETVTVEVVDVPVYVVAPDGKPVRGLTRDAFTLRIDGKTHPIEYFEVLDFGAAQPDKEVAPQRDRRLDLLLFDLTFAVPARLVKAQQAAEKAIDQSNPATDLFAVATYSSSRGVFFVTPFLRDRAALRRALHTLRASTAHDALAMTISKDERNAWKDFQGDPDSGGANAVGAGPELVDMLKGGEANQANLAEPTRRRVEELFDGIRDAVDRMRDLEGQKHVLLFTQGFDAGLVHGLPASGPGIPEVDARLMRTLEEMNRRFRAAGVMLDSVDVAGLRHSMAVDENEAALWMLARGTGGQVIHNQNDLSGALTALTSTQQVVYLLGFRRTDNRAHSIEVHVDGAPHGSNLYYRTGFGESAKGPIDAIQLADIMLNDIPQSGLTVALEVAPSAGAAAFEITLQRAEIAAQLPESAPYLDVLLYVFSDSGEAIASAATKIPFDGKAAGRNVMSIRKSIALDPGKYVARVLLRAGNTSALGFARKELVVP